MNLGLIGKVAAGVVFAVAALIAFGVVASSWSVLGLIALGLLVAVVL